MKWFWQFPNKFLILLIVYCSAIGLTNLSAQNISINFPVLDENIRRFQLSENLNQDQSLIIKPVVIPADSSFNIAYTLLTTHNDLAQLSLLPMHISYEYNSRFPFSNYNSSMIPATGGQLIGGMGVFGKLGPLQLQLQPEWFYAQNKPYSGFPQQEPDIEIIWPNSNRWRSMYRWWNIVDTPESFGSDKIQQISLGQSHLKVNFGNFGFGFSTEHLWWGPGKYNALVMTNNARSIPHFTFHTTQPVITPLGSIELEMIYGTLKNSGFFPPDTAKDFRGTKLFAPKLEEDRLINGISFVYQPKWVNGLFIGLNASIQQYKSTAKKYQDFLPLITDPIGLGQHRKDTLVRDQITSLFLRWAGHHGEFYFEYGRQNASWKWSHLMTNPQLDAAYIFGFTRLIPLAKLNRFIEFNLEFTQIQQPPDYMVSMRLTQPKSWYTHPNITQGYTNYGQIIGNRAGPGSNIQLMELSWVHHFNKIGMYLERMVHNNDFNYITYWGTMGGDFRSYWVDYTLGFQSNWQIQKLLVSGKIHFTRALNYQWETDVKAPYFEEEQRFDRDNFNLQMQIAYLF